MVSFDLFAPSLSSRKIVSPQALEDCQIKVCKEFNLATEQFLYL